MKHIFPLTGKTFSPLLPLVLYVFSPFAGAASKQLLEATLRTSLMTEIRAWQQAYPGQWQAPKVEIFLPSSTDQLPECKGEIRVGSRNSRMPVGRQSRQLICDNPTWTLRTRAEIGLTAKVVTTAERLKPEQIIQSAHLQMKWRSLRASDDDLLLVKADAVGKRLRRSAPVGKALSIKMLEKAWLVVKGQEVVIRAGGNGFAITTKGIALSSGALGQAVPVRNSGSGKRISGYVVSKGVVETRF